MKMSQWEAEISEEKIKKGKLKAKTAKGKRLKDKQNVFTLSLNLLTVHYLMYR